MKVFLDCWNMLYFLCPFSFQWVFLLSLLQLLLLFVGSNSTLLLIKKQVKSDYEGTKCWLFVFLCQIFYIKATKISFLFWAIWCTLSDNGLNVVRTGAWAETHLILTPLLFCKTSTGSWRPRFELIWPWSWNILFLVLTSCTLSYFGTLRSFLNTISVSVICSWTWWDCLVLLNSTST